MLQNFFVAAFGFRRAKGVKEGTIRFFPLVGKKPHDGVFLNLNAVCVE